MWDAIDTFKHTSNSYQQELPGEISGTLHNSLPTGEVLLISYLVVKAGGNPVVMLCWGWKGLIGEISAEQFLDHAGS